MHTYIHTVCICIQYSTYSIVDALYMDICIRMSMYACMYVHVSPHSTTQTLLLCVQQLTLWTAEVWLASSPVHVPQQHYCTALIYVYSMSVCTYMYVCTHVCICMYAYH